MSTVTLQLPDSLLERIKELADREGISLDQFLATAAAEKLATVMTEEYMDLRASRGSREKLQRILDRVPHGPPDPGDELE